MRRTLLLAILLAGCGAEEFSTDIDTGGLALIPAIDADTGVAFVGAQGCVWVEHGVALACVPCPILDGPLDGDENPSPRR